MIDKFVNSLTPEQTKQVLISCLDILKDMEVVEVMEIPLELPMLGNEGDISCFWLNSGDSVVSEKPELDFH